MHGRKKRTSGPEGRLVLTIVVRAKARTYPTGSFSAAFKVRGAGFQTRENAPIQIKGFSPGGLLKIPNPDIPEADGFALVAMRLELDRSRSVRLVKRLADIQRLALQLEVILHQDAVEQDSGIGR